MPPKGPISFPSAIFLSIFFASSIAVSPATYKKALVLQKKYSNGKNITNAFQTNAILIDDEWAEFRYIDVSADNEDKARAQIESRYPPGQGFIIDNVAEHYEHQEDE